MPDIVTTGDCIALIPARGGSKSIPRKNIKRMANAPMIAYSIVAAQQAQSVNRVVVSTDDKEIAEIALKWGAEVPYIRPAEFATDTSTDLDVFQHAMTWFSQNENTLPEIWVHLRPTYPIREPQEIDEMVDLLRNNPETDSIRSIAPAPEPPYKMWFIDDDNVITPIIECDIPEAYNQPRQVLPKTYLQNASIDVTRTNTLRQYHSMTGRKIMGYVMDHHFDIDTPEQFDAVAKELVKRDLYKNYFAIQKNKA